MIEALEFEPLGLDKVLCYPAPGCFNGTSYPWLKSVHTVDRYGKNIVQPTCKAPGLPPRHKHKACARACGYPLEV